MFNIGPMELGVLALVGLIVLGPDKLPGLARDAANMLRTLREMATGARRQLKDELGPEFANVDLSALNELRSLNPRTAITRALFSDDDEPTPSAAVVPEAPSTGRHSAPEPSASRLAAPEPSPSAVPAPAPYRPSPNGDRAAFDADAT